MISGIGNKTGGGAWRPGRGIASAAVLFLLLGMTPAGYAGIGGQRGQAVRPAPPPPPQHTAPPQQAPPPGVNNNVRPIPNAYGRGSVGEMRPGVNGRPGQEHLPEWLAQHQNMSFTEQENLLRREPGFNRLAPEQQQRVLNRLRSLDARPPAERQRMLARNEAFERLSPEGKQDVRGAAQALNQMPGDRQRMVRRAFNDLRRIPPGQREAILNSARFSHTFSPQERHVLGSLLAIEPYQQGPG